MRLILLGALLAAMTLQALACSDRPMGLMRVGEDAYLFADRGDSNWVLNAEDRTIVIDRASGSATLRVGSTGAVLAQGGVFAGEICETGSADLVIIPVAKAEDAEYFAETAQVLGQLKPLFLDPWAMLKDNGLEPLFVFGRQRVTFMKGTIESLKRDGFTFDLATATLRKGDKQYPLLLPEWFAGNGELSRYLVNLYIEKKAGEYVVQAFLYDKGFDTRAPNRYVGVRILARIRP